MPGRRENALYRRTKHLPAKERSREKAKAVVKEVKRARGRGGKSSARTAIAAAPIEADAVLTVTVHGQEMTVQVFDLQEVDGDVMATLVVSDQAGNPVSFSNPLVVRNPPVEVPDGTFYELVDDEGNVMQAMNMVEDPAEAFRLVVEHTLAVVISE